MCRWDVNDILQHDRLNVGRRIAEAQGSELAASVVSVKTSDIARLMELFQVRSILSLPDPLYMYIPELAPQILAIPASKHC